jgi:hypothetical protein
MLCRYHSWTLDSVQLCEMGLRGIHNLLFHYLICTSNVQVCREWYHYVK